MRRAALGGEAGQGRPGGTREQRGRRPSARGRRREGKGKREKEKKRERKWKKKKKKKRRGERREKGKREGGIRAGITALIAEPVGHARRPGARERDAQVEGKQGWDSGRFGCRLGSSGYREVRREMKQERDRAQRQNKD